MHIHNNNSNRNTITQNFRRSCTDKCQNPGSCSGHQAWPNASALFDRRELIICANVLHRFPEPNSI